MTNIPQFAPGCFGSALAFKSADQICRQCVFRSKCEPEHQKSLTALREKYGIKVKNKTGSLEEDDLYIGLTRKTAEIVERLKKMDIDFTSIFNSGKNPFAGRNLMPFEFITQMALSRPERPITQRELAIFFAQKLSWAPKTASAQARIISKALEYFKIVRCEGDQVISTLADMDDA